MSSKSSATPDRKRKRHRSHHKDKNESESDSTIKQEARHPNLKARIGKYLELNIDKEFFDIEDMEKTLHDKYPEYKRKKFKTFQKIVDLGFKDYLKSKQKALNAASSSSSDESEKSKSKQRKEEPPKDKKEPTKTSNGENQQNLKEKSEQVAGKVRPELQVPSTSDNRANLIGQSPTNVGTNPKPAELPQPNSSKISSESMPNSDRATIMPRLLPMSSPEPKKTEASVEPSISRVNVDASKSNESKEIQTKQQQNDVARKCLPESFIASLPNENKTGNSLSTFLAKDIPTSPILAPTKKLLTNGISRKKSTSEFEVQTSDSDFSKLGGVQKVLMQICKLMIHLKHPEVFRHIGISPTRGILLHGPPGCGKTLIANAVAGELNLPILKLAATEIVSGISGESESRLRALFEQAMASAPCILFIDEIDAITQRRDSSNKGMESRIVGQLLACMDDLNSKENVAKEGQVVVIGATNRPDVLDPALRRAGRFESEIAIGIPDENSRREILAVMSQGLNIAKNFALEKLAKLTPGYVGADLAALIREAAISAVNRILHELQPTKGSSDNLKLSDLLEWFRDDTPVSESILSSIKIDLSDFEKALKLVQPSAMREGFATVPNVSWDDIGALDDIREELEVSILAPVNHPELTKALGLGAPTGILLCGPPGCGKTLLAKAVANEAGINFISVKGPELLNMYVGESERAVRQVFQRAKNSAPCVIFFDELDALAPRRSGSGDSSGASRVVNQLLTEMDGVESRKGVYIMAATNRVDIIDPAVLRPGRLQKIVHVGLPTAPDRVCILKALTKSRPILGPDVNFNLLAEDPRCDGFSGADLSALVTEASVSAFKEHISKKIPPESAEIRVHLRHFESALSRVRPSVIGKDKLHYESMRRRHVGGGDKINKCNRFLFQNTDGATAVGTIEKESLPITPEPGKMETCEVEPEPEPEPEPVLRFLEKMEVQVKNSPQTRTIAGCVGFVTCVIPPDGCFLQIKKGNSNDEVQVQFDQLEPFIPEPGDHAKIMYSGESEERVKVLDYCASEDIGTEEESVTVLFENGDLKIFSLDQLCKVVD